MNDIEFIKGPIIHDLIFQGYLAFIRKSYTKMFIVLIAFFIIFIYSGDNYFVKHHKFCKDISSFKNVNPRVHNLYILPPFNFLFQGHYDKRMNFQAHQITFHGFSQQTKGLK